MENNKMISFNDIIKEIFNKINVFIPLIQRNYKWDSETAAKLASDLWNSFKKKQDAYTVGMITFYQDTNKMQLIDGQQRIITLYMLLKYLCKENIFTFDFERDEGIGEENRKRKYFLGNISESSNWSKEELYTDVIRFKDNYEAIKIRLEEIKHDSSRNCEFLEYIKTNVYFLLHISETEPFDEFMNLNNNKTRFVISDRIKANLIIDSGSEKKQDVLNLFSNLSKNLFSNEDAWNLVQQGYSEDKIPKGNEKRYKNKLYSDENRLKLLCCERYGSDEFDVSSTLGYEYKKEFGALEIYNNILNVLGADISTNNWNSYNAFNCLYKLDEKITFFKLLSEKELGTLEEYLIAKVDNMSYFQQACFIASQLEYSKSKLDYIDINKDIEDEFNEANNDDYTWLNNGSGEYECFKQIYANYIEEKYKEKE